MMRVTQRDPVLKLADLRRTCSLLLDEVQRRFGDQINLGDMPIDYYWNVDLAAAFDIHQGPEAHLDCGQSSDDFAEVTAAAQRGPHDVIALWHDLDHLAGVLRLLAFLDLPTRPAR